MSNDLTFIRAPAEKRPFKLLNQRHFLVPGTHLAHSGSKNVGMAQTRLNQSPPDKSHTTRNCILANNNSKPKELRQFIGPEFARLSLSMQLTLLTIRRAQLSSRKAVPPPAQRKRPQGDF
jgi:hypothetical protein